MADERAAIVYQIFCDDVRLEIGNKLSLMGVFQEVFVQQLPVVLPKMAVLTQWRGVGEYTSEVRILAPDRKTLLANSPQTVFQIPEGGYANNVNFFLNLQLEQPGEYTVQTFLNASPFLEQKIVVGKVNMQQQQGGAADETVN